MGTHMGSGVRPTHTVWWLTKGLGWVLGLVSGLGAIAPGGALGEATPVAQTAPSLTQTQPSSVAGGQQIQVNGQLLRQPWQQWQTPEGPQIGLTEATLMQQFGVHLLDSETVQTQPVQWFSVANQTPLKLATRLAEGDRYLSVQRLAQQFGWQVAVLGSTLQITTPTAQVVELRQSRQTWGDRVVLQLDRSAPWQVTERPNEILLTVAAPASEALLQQVSAIAGQYIQSIQITRLPNQTQFRIALKSAVRPRIWSTPAPDRIVVDLRPDSLVSRTILWAPGVQWRQDLLAVGAQRVAAVWLELKPGASGLRLAPILANPSGIPGIAPLQQIAQAVQVAGAINGGFFNRDRQLPLGALRRGDRWLSGPILNRGAIAWDNAGMVQFGRLTLQETILTPTGQRFPLTHLNSGYLQAGIARYTPDWGPTYTTLSNGEGIVTVQNGRVIQQQTLEQAGESVPIPPDAYLLVFRSNRSAVAAFPVGTPLTLEAATNPPTWRSLPNILGAGPLLLQNQQIVLDARAEAFSPAFASQRAARSAIAQKSDGTLLLFTTHTTLDGKGLTLLETAQLLQQLGAVHALNLDGGSSTTLYLGGQLLDRPPATAARVHNGLGLFLPVLP